ncbi:hypothetical protein NDU88_001059 [Pleurodeles waltl]|uniref:Uncharacterized protein n=1 Tax=Pleurodeles waltl TaxID=8319 RepID=A0AAV7WLD3_PLEWA|nr:hypothetical protein NDU88_001059 [Pleurodeles waltl]
MLDSSFGYSESDSGEKCARPTEARSRFGTCALCRRFAGCPLARSKCSDRLEPESEETADLAGGADPERNVLRGGADRDLPAATPPILDRALLEQAGRRYASGGGRLPGPSVDRLLPVTAGAALDITEARLSFCARWERTLTLPGARELCADPGRVAL